MIELIFILIIIEITIGLWLILKLNKLLQKIYEINTTIEKTNFSGNLTPIKYSMEKFKTQIETIVKEQKQQTAFENISKIINIVLFSIPMIKIIFKKRKLKHK